MSKNQGQPDLPPNKNHVHKNQHFWPNLSPRISKFADKESANNEGCQKELSQNHFFEEKLDVFLYFELSSQAQSNDEEKLMSRTYSSMKMDLLLSFSSAFPWNGEESRKSPRFPSDVETSRVDALDILILVSISPTFYKQLFCTRVFCAAFMCLGLWFVGKRKTEKKLLVKCWWNWLLFSSSDQMTETETFIVKICFNYSKYFSQNIPWIIKPRRTRKHCEDIIQCFLRQF